MAVILSSQLNRGRNYRHLKDRRKILLTCHVMYPDGHAIKPYIEDPKNCSYIPAKYRQFYADRETCAGNDASDSQYEG